MLLGLQCPDVTCRCDTDDTSSVFKILASRGQKVVSIVPKGYYWANCPEEPTHSVITLLISEPCADPSPVCFLPLQLRIFISTVSTSPLSTYHIVQCRYTSVRHSQVYSEFAFVVILDPCTQHRLFMRIRT